MKFALNIVMSSSDTESLTMKFIKTELQGLVGICNSCKSP